jgi:putative transposase
MPVDDAAQKWARLRFAIIAQLLAAPPGRGSLQQMIAELSKRKWKLPTGKLDTFGFSTIERWYYAAIKANNPIETLRRQSRKDAGREKAVTPQHLKELEALYKANPHWSYQLHADNLEALASEKPELNPLPSETSIRRIMKKHGWRKKKLPKNKGQQCAAQRIESRETRSYEMEHVHALWHLDFHKAKTVQVLMSDGSWETPVCLCILDDFCRLCCHIQWYLTESAETLAHGLWQAFLKRGLPYSILSDNGSAMIAAESENGMSELTTVPVNVSEIANNLR